MPPITSDALVLRTYKLGETSKVVVLLTRDRGKVRAVARARAGRARVPVGAGAAQRGPGRASRPAGRRALRLGHASCCARPSARGARAWTTALALSYFAELLDAFAQEGEAEDAVYRLALAVIAGGGGGDGGRGARAILEAWLLKLHGLYPPLDRCAACERPLPAGRAGLPRAAHGFVCVALRSGLGPVLAQARARFLRDVFRRPPGCRASPPIAAWRRSTGT